jgi:hypothetical protein
MFHPYEIKAGNGRRDTTRLYWPCSLNTTYLISVMESTPGVMVSLGKYQNKPSTRVIDSCNGILSMNPSFFEHCTNAIFHNGSRFFVLFWIFVLKENSRHAVTHNVHNERLLTYETKLQKIWTEAPQSNETLFYAERTMY